MTLYIILCFVALCAGMALSVYAFGTGGKRKRIFQDIYFSAEETDGVGVLYTKTGEYSAVLKIENPVQKYSADIDSYYDFTHLFTALAQTLGEGYAIHKQDIFVRKQFASEPADGQEFLSASYFRYFKRGPYTDSLCYLTITQEAKKSRLFSFDNKKWRDFLVKIRKVHDQLHDSGVQARFLNKAEASEYVDRYFAMNFKDRTVSMTNFKADDETVSMGDKRCKVYSLVDVDCAALPSMIRPYTNIEVNNTEMPVDLASVVDNIPDAETVVYNQVIFLPNQKRELAMLDKKKNRHASIPNPNNQMAVEDIKRVQEVIARESKQLVYTHFNMVVAVSAGADLQKCTNHLENAFGRMGIHISKRAYNQLELFVGSFPGNCYTLNEEYDRFLTLSDAAMCLMYKERVLHSEETPLKIYYTDEDGDCGNHGIPFIEGDHGAEHLQLDIHRQRGIEVIIAERVFHNGTDLIRRTERQAIGIGFMAHDVPALHLIFKVPIDKPVYRHPFARFVFEPDVVDVDMTPAGRAHVGNGHHQIPVIGRGWDRGALLGHDLISVTGQFNQHLAGLRIGQAEVFDRVVISSSHECRQRRRLRRKSKAPAAHFPFEGIIIRGVAWRNQAGIDKIGALLALSALDGGIRRHVLEGVAVIERNIVAQDPAVRFALHFGKYGKQAILRHQALGLQLPDVPGIRHQVAVEIHDAGPHPRQGEIDV